MSMCILQSSILSILNPSSYTDLYNLISQVEFVEFYPYFIDIFVRWKPGLYKQPSRCRRSLCDIYIEVSSAFVTTKQYSLLFSSHSGISEARLLISPLIFVKVPHKSQI